MKGQENWAHVSMVIMGFASYWAYVFVMYFSLSLSVDGAVALGGNQLFRIFGHLGSAVCMACLWLDVRGLRTKPRDKKLAIVVFLLGPLSALATFAAYLGIAVPWVVQCLAWFLTGYGSAFVLFKAMRLFSNLDVRTVAFGSSYAILAGALVFFSITNMGRPASYVLIALLLPAAMLFLVLSTYGAGETYGYERGGEDEGHGRVASGGNRSFSPERSASPKRGFVAGLVQHAKDIPSRYLMSSFVMLLYGMVSGATTSISIPLAIESLYVTVATASLILAGFVLLACSFFSKQESKVFENVQQGVIFCVAMGLLPLSFFDPAGRAICCGILVFGFTCFDMSSWILITKAGNHEGSSFLRVVCFSRFCNSFGVACGWAAGYALLASGQTDERSIAVLSLSLVLILVGALIVMLMRRQRIEEGEKAGNTNLWRVTCNEISDNAGLSLREREVFFLLSRGKSAERVAEELFVSKATVRSHMYSIYKKAHIHTQQELIELVETKHRKRRLKEQ